MRLPERPSETSPDEPSPNAEGAAYDAREAYPRDWLGQPADGVAALLDVATPAPIRPARRDR